jgi:hypothetical protein
MFKCQLHGYKSVLPSRFSLNKIKLVGLSLLRRSTLTVYISLACSLATRNFVDNTNVYVLSRNYDLAIIWNQPMKGTLFSRHFNVIFICSFLTVLSVYHTIQLRIMDELINNDSGKMWKKTVVT